MLDHWLRPLSPESFISMEQLSDFQWGKNILINKNGIPELTGIKMALIGIDEEATNAIRPHLYSMACHQKELPFADLGNIQKIHPDVIIPLLSELLAGGIIPIIIGRHQAYTYPQYMAYQQSKETVNAVILGERIPFTMDERKKENDYYYLNHILDQKDHFLFHLAQLGYQSHYVDKEVLMYMAEKGFECTRLALLKKQLEDWEPTIRDADLLSFDLSAIRQSDAPGQALPSPSGLFSEEASQVAYFAGLSDKLSSIGFYGFDPEKDKHHQTAQLAAQMIWYFASGVCNRYQEWPIKSEAFVQYQVSMDKSPLDLVFWKSLQTERWWFEMPESNDLRQNRHRIIACSKNDYLMASKDEIPERILQAIIRFSI